MSAAAERSLEEAEKKAAQAIPTLAGLVRDHGPTLRALLREPGSVRPEEIARVIDAASPISGAAMDRRLEDAVLIRLALDGEETAWTELLARYHAPLRAAAMDAGGANWTEADAAEAVSELWLSLIEDGKRRLRAFDPSRGAVLLSWLTIRLAQIVYRHELRRADGPELVPLTAARGLPDPSPSPDAIPPPSFLGVEEVAARWGLDRKTVYAMVERRELPSRRCGRLVKIPRKAVESFEQASVAPERTKPCR
jgi:excisionase family DNA binding protein